MKRSSNKLDLLTEYDDPNRNIRSHYGKICYKDWCTREMIRINKDYKRRVKLHTRPDGYVCLAERRKPDGTPRWEEAETLMDTRKGYSHKWEG